MSILRYAVFLLCWIKLIAANEFDPEFQHFENSADGSIVKDAAIENYPHQVSLRVNDRHICGGSIISSTKILTAAHCVDGIPIAVISVRVGSAKHLEGQALGVGSITIHPLYKRDIANYDIAILKLYKSLIYGPCVQPIQLAETRSSENSLVDITGWGAQGQDAEILSENLKVITVRIINQDTCKSWYARYGTRVTNSEVCAGYADIGTTPCAGYSGSALVDRLTGKQVGIVTWRENCPQPAIPSVFASVPDIFNDEEYRVTGVHQVD